MTTRLLLGSLAPQTARSDEYLCPSKGGDRNVAALTWIGLSQRKTAAWETLPGREGWEQAHSQALEVTEGRCFPMGMYGIYHNLAKQSLGQSKTGVKNPILQGQRRRI